MQKKWIQFLDGLEKVVTSLTALIMAILTILICYQVFARYITKSSPFWIEEISVVAMMWIALLGAAGSVWTDSHMSLELVVSRLPATARLWMKVIVDGIVTYFSWFMLQQGIVLVEGTMSGTLATLSIPIGYTYIILPISGGIMVLFAVVKSISRLVHFYTGKEAN